MSTIPNSENVIARNSQGSSTDAFISRARDSLRPLTQAISIISGKGGVGKTNIVANMGYELSRSGQSVLILDADLGLGNLDILLGLAPRYNLSHVIMGEKRIGEIVVEGPGQMKILPAASGIQELTQLSRDQKIGILSELDQLLDTVDILLIDSAAGISANALDFSVSAHQTMVVVTPEPTAITDAYALMKVLALKYGEKCCHLIVNQAVNEHEGREIFRHLNGVAERFLDIEVEYFGCVLKDEIMTVCVKQQRIASQAFPESIAARGFRKLARKTGMLPMMTASVGESHLNWNHIFQEDICAK